MKRGISILVAALLGSAGAGSAQTARARAGAEAQAQARGRLTDTRTGTVATREGQRLRLVTDIGNVRVLTEGTSPNQVSYTLRIETDSGQPEARALLQQFKVADGATLEGVQIRGSAPWKKEFRGRLWVTFEVRVPARYDIQVETGAGNVETQEIGGGAALLTLGGNVTTGRINGSAKINTAGGHIKLGDVSGDVNAVTGGGHIEVGRVDGVAMLRSEGGHVRAESVQKWAELRTAGGNIYLNRTGGKVIAESGGGQINLGEVAGSVMAKTGGGGIQIARVSGPTNIETGGGSIYLQQISNTVQANTGSGQIVAWFVATGPKEMEGISQLVCGQGDIVVYLPRQIAMNIEATIEAAGEHHIDADPQLNLKQVYVRSAEGPRVLRAVGMLNGGGKLLKLRTVAGNIKLAFVEGAPTGSVPAPMEPPSDPPAEKQAWQVWRDRMQLRMRGSLDVNSEIQSQRLISKVKPNYPERARKEGVEGWVWLYVVIDEKGAVEDLNVISGHPWLAEPAAEAVKQWRYRPTLLDGQPVKVSTVVKVAFSLK